MISTDDEDILPAWLWEQKHLDNVNNLLRAHSTEQFNNDMILAVVSIFESSRYVIWADLAWEWRLSRIWLTSKASTERNWLQENNKDFIELLAHWIALTQRKLLYAFSRAWLMRRNDQLQQVWLDDSDSDNCK